MPDGIAADEVRRRFGGRGAPMNETAEISEMVGVLMLRGKMDLDWAPFS
jgi:hypothetical protein